MTSPSTRSSASAVRRQLRELDDQIHRCQAEIAANAAGADDAERAARNLTLGSLTMRRLVTLQWL